MQISVEKLVSMLSILGVVQTAKQGVFHQIAQEAVPSRVWRNVIEERTKGAWYLNNSGNEMDVHMTTDHVDEGGGICVYMRPDGDSPHLTFYGQFALNGFPNSSVLNITVPDGWQYHLTTDNMGQTRQITSWLELS